MFPLSKKSYTFVTETKKTLFVSIRNFINMTEKRNTKYLQKVLEFFMQNGIKSHTMDDISKFLGISKKTLYSFVSSKNDLVNQVMTLTMEDDKQQCISIVENEGNAIDKIYAINKKVSEKLQKTQPVVIYDLKNYYPEAWQILNAYRSDFIFLEIKNSLEVGIKEGLFRDINVDIIARANISLIYSIFEDKLFPTNKYTFIEIHEEIVKYHIRGIANEKGLKYINQLLSKNKEISFKN